MDRLFTRRGVMIGAGASAAAIVATEPVLAEPAPTALVAVERATPRLSIHNGPNSPRIDFTARLVRGGDQPIDVMLDISAGPMLASVDVMPLEGDPRMWGAIESNDPAVCRFLQDLAKSIYTESGQVPEFAQMWVGARPENAPDWLSGTWVSCPACSAATQDGCSACGGRGSVWESWVAR